MRPGTSLDPKGIQIRRTHPPPYSSEASLMETGSSETDTKPATIQIDLPNTESVSHPESPTTSDETAKIETIQSPKGSPTPIEQSDRGAMSPLPNPMPSPGPKQTRSAPANQMTTAPFTRPFRMFDQPRPLIVAIEPRPEESLSLNAGALPQIVLADVIQSTITNLCRLRWGPGQ